MGQSIIFPGFSLVSFEIDIKRIVGKRFKFVCLSALLSGYC